MLAACDGGLLYRLLRGLVRGLLRLLTRLEVSGVENVPATGPLIVAPNHLSILDTPLIFAVVPRRMTAFAADKWSTGPVGWLLSGVGRAIFVRRGTADRRALSRAVAALAAGAALGIAPEGTRSRQGGLQEGKNGIAYLCGRTGATIVPVAIWGQEATFHCWAHLERPLIHMRIGAPLRLPSEAASATSTGLSLYTRQVMLSLARMLPRGYRGVYPDACCDACTEIVK